MKYLVCLAFFVSCIALVISCSTSKCKENSEDKGTSPTLGVKHILYLSFSGTSCEVFHDCQDHYEQGHTCSGIYTIKPDHLPAFKVLKLQLNKLQNCHLGVL